MFPSQMFPSQMFPSQMFPQQEPFSGAPEQHQEPKQPQEPPGDESRTNPEPEMRSGPFPSAPPPIAPSRLRDIEERLLCADEADSELESGEPGPPAGPPAGPAGPAAGPAGPAAGPAGPAAGPAEPGDSRWLGAGAALRAALREGSARCRQRDFAAAAGKFCVALELCSKGFATEDPLKSSPAEISRLVSWIEAKLCICYLKLGQPSLALLHSHRSIIENPSHFCNHLRQAACFRCLHRYSEAARSAMLAQCLYVLAEGAGLDTSDRLQLYWQAMIQEALSAEMSFCALYTPFDKEDKADKIKEANKTFAERHPEYVQHIFTDPHGIHLLPEKAESQPGQQYLLTLGFRNREIGKTLEKFVTQKMPIFPGQKITWSPSTEGEAEKFWQSTGKGIVAALAFLGSTKIKDERGPCARAIEHLQLATLLGHLHRGEEQAQVLSQGMAELATVPHLQRVSQEDHQLLQSLMADAVDILAGRTGERAWAKIHKVALIEEFLREAEDFYSRPPRTSMPAVENISWTPKGRRYLRLENSNVFIPNPRSLAPGLKKRRILFAKS